MCNKRLKQNTKAFTTLVTSAHDRDAVTAPEQLGKLRPGLQETPARAAKAFEFLTSGYDVVDLREVLKTFTDGVAHKPSHSDPESILNIEPASFAPVHQYGIPVYSMCEHHLLPFFGVARIAYVPTEQVVGLSKLSRLVDVFAKRLQTQERLTSQIGESLMQVVACHGVAVQLHCRHMCMESRGVQRTGTITETTHFTGDYQAWDYAHRAQFLNFTAPTQL